MKRKLTMVLSLASLLALTPTASILAKTTGDMGTSASAPAPASQSQPSNGTSASSPISSNPGTSASLPISSDAGTGSSDKKSDAGTGNNNSSESNKDTKSDHSDKNSGTETEKNNHSETTADQAKNSSETKVDTGTEKSKTTIENNTNIEQVTKLSETLGDLRSKLDKQEYEKYQKDQQAENDLFDVKQNKDFKAAVSDFQQSLKANPENKTLYVELALTYLANGDLKNAEETAKQLDAKAPESYLSLILQAELAASQGKSTEKQLFLKKAVDKNPTSAVAQLKLGEELNATGNYDEAAAHLLTAAALNPKNEKVFEELNKVFAKTKTLEIKTFVNGVVPKFEVKPFIENNSTLIPIRAISESLGAKVGWDGTNQQVSIERGNTKIELTIDSKVAIVNGKETMIDAPAKIVNGSTVLPLRFVSESLGAKVDWKAESQMIVISE